MDGDNILRVKEVSEIQIEVMAFLRFILLLFSFLPSFDQNVDLLYIQVFYCKLNNSTNAILRKIIHFTYSFLLFLLFRDSVSS
jgi:hypothetical protein